MTEKDTKYKFSDDVLQITIQSKDATELCKAISTIQILGYDLLTKGNIKQKIVNNKEEFYCTLVFDKSDVFNKYARKNINRHIFGIGIVKE